MALASSPTDRIVIAESQYSTMSPKRMDVNTIGDSMFTPLVTRETSADTLVEHRVMEVPKSASDTSVADPIANPLLVAVVMLPEASITSVLSRTDESISDISATPPVLSSMGPYTSMTRKVASVPSMPSAVVATPHMPTILKDM
jgi:hypothetical protein